MHCTVKGYGINSEGERFEIGESGKAIVILTNLILYQGCILHVTITFHD